MDVLTRYVLPRSVEQATQYLEKFSNTIQLLSLFKEFFGEEWKNSTAHLDNTILYHQKCSQLVELFLELVDEQLFPLRLDIYDIEEIPYSIPFYPYDIDFTDGIEDFEGGLRFLLELYTSELGQTRDDIANDIDWNKFHAVCIEAPEPLCYLFDAFSVIDHSTGTYWLDCSQEWYESFEWNPQTLRLLARDWQEAQEFLEKLNTVVEWLEEDPSRQALVIELWNSAERKI